MHPPIGGGVSTDFKSSNRIKISRLVQILLHFYWFWAPYPPGGVGGGWGGYMRDWGWCENLLNDVGMMWGRQGWRGDDGDDVGTTGTTCGDHGDHGDHRPWGPHGDLLRAMGTTWRWWGWCGDDGYDPGTTWGWQGRCGDHGDNMWRPRGQHVETTGTTCGDHRDHGDHRPWGPHGDLLRAMGMMWAWRGWCRDNGDDAGMTGGRWGQRGDNGDNEITKTAITFEWIEIIEFCLKIWDPWTLPHTCGLHLICRWGVSYPKWHFYAKSAPVTLGNKIFLLFHWIPLDHI